MRKRPSVPVLLVGLLLPGLAACSAQAVATPTPTPDPVGVGGGVISATARVVPAEWTVLSFAVAGRVDELPVEDGEEVAEAALVARLDTATLQAEIAEAQAALAEAEANLANVLAGPSQEQILAAERALSAAYARTQAATARRDALYEQDNEAELVEANNQLINAQHQFSMAREGVQQMEQFDPDNCRIYWSRDDECPLSEWGPRQEYFELAQLQLEAAQVYVEELQRGPDADQVRIETARISVAGAQAAAARARLDLLRAQPFPEDVAVAQAEVEQARAGLEAARARLSEAELRAPFGGTVAAVYANTGEFVAAGQRIAQLGDLETLRVETTDLNEIDVARIAVGDAVTVTFDALPGVEVPGQVARIAPRAAEGTGVNYTVVIELDEIPPTVRWGMTAFVDIVVETAQEVSQ